MKLRHAFAVGTWAVLISAVAHAEDWSLSTWHAGPRSSVAYESSSVARDNRMRRAAIRKSRVVRHKRVEHRQEPEVRLYRADEGRKGGVHCQAPMRGLGTQWVGREGALNAARKDWMEHVRYDLGESYLDMSNARDEISRCGRTSIGEAMGQVMYRCEIVARPCKAPMTASGE